MIINTNVSSLNAREANSNTNVAIKSSLERLSTGYKINKASDDASGLAIADKLRTQATSIGQGIDNAASAITLLQIADKSMAEQSNILDIVKAKLIQANTDTTSDDGRASILKDIGKLLNQLDNIASQTNYNGRGLINDNAHTFQIGEKASDTISTSTVNSTNIGLGGGTAASVSVNTGDTNSSFSGTDLYSGSFTTTGSATITLDLNRNGTLINQGSSAITLFPANAASGEALTGISMASPVDLAVGESISFSDWYIDVGLSVALDSNSKFTIANAELDSIANSSGSSSTVDFSGVYNPAGSITISGLQGLNTLTTSASSAYQDSVNDALTKLNEFRADIGSTQNQVESAMRNLMTQETNVKAAESIIRDVDYAEESSSFNKLNIISQAGAYAISQANASQQNILRLLQ